MLLSKIILISFLIYSWQELCDSLRTDGRGIWLFFTLGTLDWKPRGNSFYICFEKSLRRTVFRVFIPASLVLSGRCDSDASEFESWMHSNHSSVGVLTDFLLSLVHLGVDLAANSLLTSSRLTRHAGIKRSHLKSWMWVVMWIRTITRFIRESSRGTMFHTGTRNCESNCAAISLWLLSPFL